MSENTTKKLDAIRMSALCLKPCHSDQVKLHVCIMQVLLALRTGDLLSILDSTVGTDCENQLKPKKLPSIVREMETLSQRTTSDPMVFNLAPWPITKAIVNLLSSTLLRQQGKTTLALEYAQAGLGDISRELERFGLGRKGEDQSSSNYTDACEVELYVVHRYLLLENYAQILLLRCEFMQAQVVLTDIIQLLGSWPSLLPKLRFVYAPIHPVFTDFFTV